MSAARKPVVVVVGATSKWQADGRNTRLAHGKVLDDRDLPVGIRWGVGGAIAQKFAREGFFVVLTTRNAANAAAAANIDKIPCFLIVPPRLRWVWIEQDKKSWPSRQMRLASNKSSSFESRFE